MKALVVGLGSMGRRHIKNIKAIDENIQIAVWRQYSKINGLGELESLVENVFFSADDALQWKPDAVFVTNPAPMHCKTALLFAQQNSHLFIEKPLSNDIVNINILLKECEQRKLILMVGYVLRFFEPLQIIKKILEQSRIGRILSIRASVGQNLLNWRSEQRYQDSVSARKDLGGGVLLELSHELDYMRWLVGEVAEIRALASKVSDMEIDVEDIAEICLRFKDGILGSIHLDMIDYAANRSCRIIGSEGTVKWDSEDDDCVRLYSSKTDCWTDLRKPGTLDKNEMYIDELKHFFNCIAMNQKPLISGKEGRSVVKMIVAARCSAESGKAVLL